MDERDNNVNNTEKVQALREMIYAAEKTLQGAKAMLLQLEGKKKVGRKKKVEEDEDGGKIIEGTFDGQIMIGSDGKQYPVPANYASKSKLIEGDMLKLTITSDGSFVYKQIGPAERKRLIGVVGQDEDGNYFVAAEGKPYRVLLASVTYFKVEPGDEVTLVAPRDMDSDWGSIENVIQPARNRMKAHTAPVFTSLPTPAKKIDDIFESDIDDSDFTDIHRDETTVQAEIKKTPDMSIIDEWAPDFEKLKEELNKPLE
jgi:hypothetical protein